MRRIPDPLLALAASQHGLLTISQLGDHGFDGRTALRRVDAGLWQRISTRVFSTQPHPLTRPALLWAASLHFEGLGLTGSSALEISGMPTPTPARIDLVGPRGGRPAPLRNSRIHTCRDGVEFEIDQPMRTRIPLALVHATAWAASKRQAIFFVTWTLQRRLATIEQFEAEARSKPQSGLHRRAVKIALAVDEGIHSIHEFDFLRECRRRMLPEPTRQRERKDSRGRKRYTDFEFQAKGRNVVVEVDGLGHLDADVQLDDQWRANELALQGSTVLRIPGLALRLDPDPFFAQLQRAIDQLRNAA